MCSGGVVGLATGMLKGAAGQLAVTFGSFRELGVPVPCFGVLIIRILLSRVLLHQGPLFSETPMLVSGSGNK